MKNFKFLRPAPVLFIILLISTFTFNSCSDDPVTSSTSENLDVSTFRSDDISDPSGVLTISEAKILIKDIKLNVDGSDDESNFKTGPFVFYLNTFFSVNTVTTSMIPAGTYDKIIFKIHKPNPNDVVPDPEFTDGGRYSVIVKGFYNGNPFVFKSDITANQKLRFPNSLVMTSLGKTNITILAKPYLWFYEDGVFLDPTNPSNHNNIEHLIKDNVNINIRAFRDDDRNGVPD